MVAQSLPRTVVTEGELRLDDGRRLGFATYGDPGGRPVLHFHGSPSSRLEFRPNHEAAAERGLRVICPERPGLGLSSPHRRGTFATWAADVTALADALELDRFAVSAWSGGAPYAAACAHALGPRIVGLSIVAGLSHRPDLRGSRRGRLRLLGEQVVKALLLLHFSRLARKDPSRLLRLLLTNLAPEDREVLAEPAIWSNERLNLAEAFRRGARPGLRELSLLTRPWGFRVDEITQPVHLWQGERDRSVPPDQGRDWAASLPRCRSTFLPEEGHMAFYRRSHEILDALAALLEEAVTTPETKS